jgi:hypothetical protein
MDVFTYRLPAFQAFPAAHSLSRELHHLATLNVPRTVHTHSHDTEHLTAQNEALRFRDCLVQLSVHKITAYGMLETYENVMNSSSGRNLDKPQHQSGVGTTSPVFS